MTSGLAHLPYSWFLVCINRGQPLMISLFGVVGGGGEKGISKRVIKSDMWWYMGHVGSGDMIYAHC